MEFLGDMYFNVDMDAAFEGFEDGFNDPGMLAQKKNKGAFAQMDAGDKGETPDMQFSDNTMEFLGDMYFLVEMDAAFEGGSNDPGMLAQMDADLEADFSGDEEDKPEGKKGKKGSKKDDDEDDEGDFDLADFDFDFEDFDWENFDFEAEFDGPEGDKPEGDKPEGDKPEGDKPEGDKPEEVEE